MKNRSVHLNFSMIAVIMSLAWPTMLEQLMQTAVQYIDTAMVGSLGTHATAAVGATSTVNWLIGSTIGGILAGQFGKHIPVKWLHRGLGILILWGGIRYLW